MPNKANTLILDTETTPNLAWVWGMWEQNVIAFEREWHFLCYSYKWLGKKTYVDALPDYSLYKKDKENDKQLMMTLRGLLDNADVVVAHNGDAFDIRKINARFAYHKIPPPSPYKTVDTKKVARKHFAFNSNKLNSLGEHLGLGKKVETGGFSLWKGCMSGDEKSWRLMKRYNKQDVDLLEEIYLFMRPWMNNHPNLSVIYGEAVCPKCSSDKIQFRGLQVTSAQVYRRFQCQGCGGWGRVRKAEKREPTLTHV